MTSIMHVIDIFYGAAYHTILICNISDTRRTGKLPYHELRGDISVGGNTRLVSPLNCHTSDNIM